MFTMPRVKLTELAVIEKIIAMMIESIEIARIVSSKVKPFLGGRELSFI